MSAIGGTVKLGEAAGVSAAIAKRQRGPRWQYYALLSVLCGIGIAAAVLLSRTGHLPIPKTIVAPIGAIAGALAYSGLAPKLVRSRWRERVTHTGGATELPFTLETKNEALHYRIGGVTSIADWNIISEVFQHGEYLVIFAQHFQVIVPLRSLEGEAFDSLMADLKSHLPPEVFQHRKLYG